MRLDVNVVEGKFNRGARGDLQGEGDVLVVVVVGRVVRRLHSPACATRTIAASAGTEKKIKITETPSLPSLTCIPKAFVAVIDGLRVGAGPCLRCFAFTVASRRCGPGSPGTVDHAVGMVVRSAQVVGGAVCFFLRVAFASLASVGRRWVVADPGFHFLASRLAVLVVAAGAPSLPVPPLSINRSWLVCHLRIENRNSHQFQQSITFFQVALKPALF